MKKINTTRNSFGRRQYGGFRNRRPRSFQKNHAIKLDISSFIEKSNNRASEPIVETAIKHTFADFGFSEIIEKNLEYLGYKTPTPIQDEAIGHIMEGRDLIGMANTGTGKTAAFLLPMLQKVYSDRSQNVLVIAPTRELALQIEDELKKFGGGMKINYTTCVGGMPIYHQIRSLKNSNPNFIIGTPGRIKDLADRGLIRFRTFNNIVLDEVDRMLDMGFVDEIKYFLSELANERQSLFFSATLPPKIKQLIETNSQNPVLVQTKTQEVALNVEQSIVRVFKDAKFGKLKEILKGPEVEKVLIFSETKRDVDRLSNDLNNQGFKTESIHGDKRQHQRQKALDSFKGDRVNVLVATDVAARGLDIKGVTHVINYTLPQSYEDYIHRIGRTGRAGSLGKALTFVE